MSDCTVNGVNWWEERGRLTALIVILNLIWLTRLDQINLIGRWRGGGRGMERGKEMDVPCLQSALPIFAFTHIWRKFYRKWLSFGLFVFKSLWKKCNCRPKPKLLLFIFLLCSCTGFPMNIYSGFLVLSSV